jgi:hypothetical protein
LAPKLAISSIRISKGTRTSSRKAQTAFSPPLYHLLTVGTWSEQGSAMQPRVPG